MAALLIPRLFLPSVIRTVVAPGQPGAYAIGNDRNGFVAGYVGRSNTCLRSRLATHNHLYAFEYFVFRYADSPEEAFAAECEFITSPGSSGYRYATTSPCVAGDECRTDVPLLRVRFPLAPLHERRGAPGGTRPPGLRRHLVTAPGHCSSSPLTFAQRRRRRRADTGGIV